MDRSSPEAVKNPDIALIELGGSHEECLYSQVLFLREYGYRVHVLIREDHLARMETWPEVHHWKTFRSPSGLAGEWKLVFGVLRYLRRNNIHKAVINTAGGNIIRKLSRISGKRTDLTGLLHLGSKLWTSRSQRIISRKIRKYFVLAEFIRENLDRADPALSIGYFYPVYFPGKADAGRPAAGMNFLVCIPGAVDFKRRDYGSLLEEIVAHGVPDGIRFVLLGRTTGPDGQALIARIRDLKLQDHFITFGGFVDHATFYHHVRISNLILPLITPQSHDYEDYRRYKVTGAYSLSWGFQIPMLMHASFADYRIFRLTSVFYRSGELMETLQALSGKDDRIGKIRAKMSGMNDFNFPSQAENYIQLVRS